MGLDISGEIYNRRGRYIQTERGVPSWRPSLRWTEHSRHPSKLASSASPRSFPLTSQLQSDEDGYG